MYGLKLGRKLRFHRRESVGIVSGSRPDSKRLTLYNLFGRVESLLLLLTREPGSASSALINSDIVTAFSLPEVKNISPDAAWYCANPTSTAMRTILVGVLLPTPCYNRPL